MAGLNRSDAPVGERALEKRLSELSSEVGHALQARAWILSSAESCTGGWVSQCITDTAGSSAWFDSGIVSYSNESKQKLLCVPGALLEGENAPGAVSEETVLAMARGMLSVSAADIAVSTSGVAGPGASEAKPAGTVWIGWAWRNDRGVGTDSAASAGKLARAQLFHFEGDRYAVRLQSVISALEGVLQRCNSE